ncbi:hypothetical protein [Butyrivibrio sp. VCB2006]|uniref:hypothetical protein n=1 Tax=Butyrivibrio sp. VCB2006 TaxID=1280679 RepID=UPI000492B41E|nr:hypothetical protein [Butyrivibrio sp. VCB2006]
MRGRWQKICRHAVVDGYKGTSAKPTINKRYILQTIRTLKEVSFSASMTLEASIALPLFIFFFVNIIGAIEIIRVQSDVEAVLHQVGNEVTIRAYDIREGENLLGADGGGTILEGGALSGYAIYEVRSRLSERLDRNTVMDGSSGLNMLSSRIMMSGDIVDIVARYKVHPVIPLIGFKDFLVESRYYGHAWTGYDISFGPDTEAMQEEMVYVTEHGTVYHRNVGCKYLKPSVKSVHFSDVGGLRNKDRSKYYACEYCGGKVAGGDVFITDYGEKYHTSVSCPGLKRKIYTIPISEVGGRGPCSACGG